MNEITRIHLAKVPYSIEIDAKKALQKYLDAITTYAGLELSADVESRMVEILADRKVAAGGVVTMADVKALQGQLGAPEEFSDETAVMAADETSAATHRLYRDTTRGWFGGVAAGIARYFGVNPLWIRFAFIVLAFFSFGMIALIYLVLWLIIPPVRTAADILQLEGKPATVTAIHALNERGGVIPLGRDRRFARTLSVLAGLCAMFGGLMLLIGLVVVGVRSLMHGGVTQFFTGDASVGVIYELVMLIGVLLFIVLLGLIAYFLFSWKWTRRLWISGIIIIVLGMTAAGVVATGAITNRVAFERQLNSLTRTTSTQLPTGFDHVMNLSLSADGVDQVTYIVSNKPRIEVEALAGSKAPKVSLNGDTATITLDETRIAHGPAEHFIGYQPSIVTIYGPALQHITLQKGSLTYDLVNDQTKTLTADVTDGTQLSLSGGSIMALNATVAGDGSFDATGTAAHAVTLKLGTNASATLGNIASLDLTAPDVCPTGDQTASLDVGSVNASDIMYNGKQIAKRAMTSACAARSASIIKGNRVIETDHIKKTYGRKSSAFQALKDVSLTIKTGESVAITGKSGSGKSTLMHLLALLDQPTSGGILLDGHNTTEIHERELDRLRNREFGFVFQQFYLNAHDSVLNNVMLPLKIAGVSIGERRKRAMAALEAVEMTDKAKNRANDLSGGQKQRVCIARALVNDPSVIFADEPTGNLDTATGAVIESLLFNLHRDKGITLIIVTHDPDLADKCDREIEIRDGEVVNVKVNQQVGEAAK